MATIAEVQREADKWGRRAEVDMTGVADPVKRAVQVMNVGISLVLYHRSIDEEVTAGALWNDAACQIVKDLCSLGLDVAVVGRIDG
jgi:3-keto-L-gulonate-6-phosphate decarboxylase